LEQYIVNIFPCESLTDRPAASDFD